MTSIGGQAIIEGVMMRGPKKIAMAVRKPDGEIVIEEKEAKGIGKWAKYPIIRGCVSFVSSMVIGVQALMFSAKFFDIEEDEAEKEKANKKALKKAEKGAKKCTKKEQNIEEIPSELNDKDEMSSAEINESENQDSVINVGNSQVIEESQSESNEKIPENKWVEKTNDLAEGNGLSDGAMYFTVFLSLLLSVGMFILLPNFVADLIVPEGSVTLYNIVENIIKIAIFLVYLLAVSRMKDIQRVFEYHGAEHKSIFCYESGEELTPENVKKYSRFHPRCGTSFLLFVIIVSIIFFSCLPRFDFVLLNMLVRLLLMPIVAGISYEIIRFAGKSKNKCVMILNKPGMWLQKFTTREPDEKQIEVAIASLKAVIPENGEDDRW